MKKLKKKRIFGTSERPRLAVFKAENNIHVQLIDDINGVTLAAASTTDPKLKKKGKSGGTIEAAKVIGTDISKKALEKGITKIVFDRGGRLYHGRIKALADAARAAGLQF
jgi:large subunit ribosomal protein L18